MKDNLIEEEELKEKREVLENLYEAIIQFEIEDSESMSYGD